MLACDQAAVGQLPQPDRQVVTLGHQVNVPVGDVQRDAHLRILCREPPQQRRLNPHFAAAVKNGDECYEL